MRFEIAFLPSQERRDFVRSKRQNGANGSWGCSLIRAWANICHTLQPTHAVSLYPQENSKTYETFFELESKSSFNDDYRGWSCLIKVTPAVALIVSLKSRAVATKSWTAESMRCPTQTKGAHESDQVGTKWLRDAICSSIKYFNALCGHICHHVGPPRSKWSEPSFLHLFVNLNWCCSVNKGSHSILRCLGCTLLVALSWLTALPHPWVTTWSEPSKWGLSAGWLLKHKTASDRLNIHLFRWKASLFLRCITESEDFFSNHWTWLITHITP